MNAMLHTHTRAEWQQTSQRKEEEKNKIMKINKTTTKIRKKTKILKLKNIELKKIFFFHINIGTYMPYIMEYYFIILIFFCCRCC